MTHPYDPEQDTFGLQDALQRALEDPLLERLHAEKPSEPSVAAAAFRVAAALGKLRLADAPGGPHDGHLDEPLALAAVDGMRREARHMTEFTNKLPESMDAALAPEQEIDMACTVIQAAFDLWAAEEAVNEAVNELNARAADAGVMPTFESPVEKALEEWREEADALDEAMYAQRESLTLACDTHLLNNLRTVLSEERKQSMPWWLNGAIERVAQRRLEAVIEDMPPARTKADIAGRVGPHWLGPVKPARLAAAAAVPGNPFTGSVIAKYTFRRPQDGASAVLRVKAEGGEDDALTVAFHTADDQPILNLTGGLVTLGGVEARINARGVATFRRGDLRAAADFLPDFLLAGMPPAIWLLDREPANDAQ